MTGIDRLELSRRAFLAASAVAGVAPFAITYAQEATPIASPAGTPAATPIPAPPAGWFSYGYDLSGGKATLDGAIGASNVRDLGLAWSFEVDGPVTSTPVFADGVTFVGSYDGNLYAIDLATGANVWTYATGAAVMEPNLQIPLGIPGSAHVNGDVVYVGDSAAVLHAIDRSSGEVIWKTTIDDQPNACIWSSPVVWNGLVFVGSASIAKEDGFRGGVVALDAATGEITWHTFVVPDGADGAGVFTVPAIDIVRGLVYVGTQNAYNTSPSPYGNPISIVAMDAATGDINWTFNAPPNDGKSAPTDDVGFSASPNLFTVTIDGTPRDLIGQGQKSGDFWVLDRETGEQIWTTNLSPAGFLGGMEGTSAVANGKIAVPATNWPDFDGPATGSVKLLNAITGEILWTADESSPVPGPVAISNDLVFHAGLDGVLHAFALVSGTELWSADMQASASGGVGVNGGYVVVGAATPQFADFIKTGSTINAYVVGGTPVATAAPATPEASPMASPVS